jgi:hypothetical protein
LGVFKLGVSAGTAMVKTKARARRGIVVTLAVALFSVSFAISSHIVSKGATRWITRDHEVRRVLSRAERDNLKIGPTFDKDTPLPDSWQQVSEAPLPPEILVVFYRIFAAPLILMEPKSSVLGRSPVLNL